MTETLEYIGEHLNDLANLVESYIFEDQNFNCPAIHGHWELVTQLYNINEGLSGACLGGYLELAENLIDRGADDVNYAMENACIGGHIELAEFMISCVVQIILMIV